MTVILLKNSALPNSEHQQTFNRDYNWFET